MRADLFGTSDNWLADIDDEGHSAYDSLPLNACTLRVVHKSTGVEYAMHQLHLRQNGEGNAVPEVVDFEVSI